MDKSKISVLVSGALSALFGCSHPVMIDSRTYLTHDGREITMRVYNDGMTTYQQGAGQVVESDSSKPSYTAAKQDFEMAAATNPVAETRKAAAAAREELAPASSPRQEVPAVAPPTQFGPKVDLPTQTYQAPAGTSYPPSGGYPH